MKKILLGLLLLAGAAAPAPGAAAEPMRIGTEASEVTLFIDGAQVTRRKQLDIPSGQTTLRFTGLSPYLDEKSIRLEARGALTVLAVDRTADRSDTLARTEARMRLGRAIAEAERRERLAAAEADALTAEYELLKANCSVAGRTAATPLSAIRELNEYHASELRRLKRLETQLADERRSIADELRRLRTELAQAGGKGVTPGAVEVRIEAAAPCRADFTLRYYVPNAGWFPSYDIRSEGLDAPLELIYKANIFQHTHETWNDVSLTLSSSNPATGNVAPQLRTWWLDYGLGAPRYDLAANGGPISGTVVDATTREPLIGATVRVPGTTVGTATDVDGRYGITLPAGASSLEFSFIGYRSQTNPVSGARMDAALQPDMQALDEVVVVAYGSAAGERGRKRFTGKAAARNAETDSEAAMPEAAPMEVAATQNRLGYEFEIRRPYTVHSDGKSVAAEIGRFRLPARYAYEAVPLVDRDAFLVAEAVGWEELELLQGEASIYFDGTFVGKSILDPARTSDTLRFSLGRDSGLHIERTKLQDFTQQRIVGQNRTQSIAWKIALRNTRRQPIEATIRDQLPVSRNSAITVAEEELSGGTLDRQTGIVTWRLTLAPGEQRDLELRYTVKYPKDRHLALE